MYDVEAAGNGFHTKGYIFKKEEIYRIIIGSSNMTSAALTVNKEWNTKLISTESGEIAEEIVDEFQNLWNSEYALPYDDFYEVYKEITPQNAQQDFEQFSNWAKMLLQDFNEIDRYLLKPSHVFDYLKNIDDINHWSVNILYPFCNVTSHVI